MNLVQALYQTQRFLEERQGSEPGFDELAASVDAVLSRYQEQRSGEVAYAEEGADVIDRTGAHPDAQMNEVQAALIAFVDRPTPETADLARGSLDRLHDTITS